MNNVCRCCLSEACYKDLSIEYFCSGQREVYADMLLETYSINLSQQNHLKGMICEACIIKLRNAAAFKKQVLAAEETILKQFKIIKESDRTPKLEPDNDYDFDDKISANINLADFCWPIENKSFKNKDEGQIFVIKLEPKEQKNRKKFTPNIKPTDKSENTEGRKGRFNALKNNNGVKKNVSKSMKAVSKNNEIAPAQKVPAKTPPSQTQIALRENTFKLIRNSNMCLFKSLKNKFGCYICNESFIKMPHLREHSKMHFKNKQISVKLKRLSSISFQNVDISSLACRSCSAPCNNLSDLREHLEKTHGLIFGNGEHLLIPYKLENDFQCVLCNEKFQTFLSLSIHMNKHSTSNVCETCGGSFYNRLSLRTHINSMHREKTCSQCSATFATNSARTRHMQKNHSVGPYKRYCILCHKTFRYTYLLVKHKVLEHGEERSSYNCPECGKLFHTTQNLRIHVRSVHIRERNYPCGICDLRFFTKCDKNRHERTHDEDRSFICEYCEGKFKAKDSLRRHLKRQHSHMFETIDEADFCGVQCCGTSNT